MCIILYQLFYLFFILLVGQVKSVVHGPGVNSNPSVTMHSHFTHIILEKNALDSWSYLLKYGRLIIKRQQPTR